MKQAIILWAAAAIIAFIAGYTQNTTSSYYPINGTVDISSGEISYSFDKIFRGKGSYQVLVVGDFTNQTSMLMWKDENNSSKWNNIPLRNSNNELIGEIPQHQPMSKVEYRVRLNDNGKFILLPQTQNITMQFLGNVPSQIMQFYFITLFAGILLSIRTSLEIFTERPRIKMYTIFTLISFFSFTLIFSTVKRGCELGLIGGTKIAPLNELFSSGPVLLLSAWILALILVFNSKKSKFWAVIAGIATLIIFFFGRF
ncbi:MAG: hypothetical protein M1480_17290 [Bacteroidetes bacterium]|nr:hypothetical protein [Bacteroidota bacterium]